MIIGVLIIGAVFLGLLTYRWTLALMRNKPERALIYNLPILLFPYLYLIGIAVVIRNDVNIDLIFPLLIYFIVFIGLIVGGAAAVLNINFYGSLSPKRGSWLSMMIKLIHIPAFIINFELAVMGLMMSIWGIGIIIFVSIVDLLTIIVSGTYALAAVMNMKKRGVIGTGIAAGLAVLSYLYCVDVIAAIVMFVLCRKHEKKVEMIVERYRAVE